ncbi:sensor histidine kinase [Hypericibacter terrae]|uniref:sensor histidine kinase n=1 Tax=Hypericibacter terrae TaxID=2602015 RepID=UPI001244B3BD|nr:PAS domain-containing sensor histidine kinase [Hypericibacter terrae]
MLGLVRAASSGLAIAAVGLGAPRWALAAEAGEMAGWGSGWLLTALLLGLLVGLVAAGLLVRRERTRAVAREREAAIERTTLENARAEAAGQIASIAGQRDGLQQILDNIPVPIWRRRGDLSLDFVNLAYARAVEADRPKVLLEQTELAGGRALAERARDLGLGQSESRPTVVGGERLLFDFNEQPLPDGRLIGYARDMTSVESTQFELARHIQAHGEVLEQLSTGIIILGPDARVKFFNSAYTRLWGLEAEFLRSEPTLEQLLEQLREKRRLPEQPDFPAYKRELRRSLMSAINPLEALLHLPDNRTIRRVAAPHPFGGIVMTFEDVTDTLALERSYNTLIDVQRETLDNLFEGVAVFGADGRLKLFNPAFVRMWGFHEGDLVDEPHATQLVDLIRSFFETVAWPRLKQRMIDRLQDRTARTGRMERADGSTIDFAAVPLPDGACLMIYMDVSDSVRVQRALAERNAALETADRLKSEFIANVSYELRTPLNAIIGFAEILDQQYFGPLTERQAEYSHGIIDASQQLLLLINDILDIATIEAGYLQLELAPVDVAAMLKDLVTLSAERARSRGVALELDCPPDIGRVTGDERRLKQAIYNLISNAMKFTPLGGAVRMAARRTEGQLEIEVVDNGVGIAEQDQGQAFQKFARVGGRRQSGSGLGLALVKSLIELHGGQVELVSKPGVGTRVACRLPATPSDAPIDTPERRAAG